MKKILVFFILIASLSGVVVNAQRIDDSEAENINRYTKVPPPEIFTNKAILNKTTNTVISVDFSQIFPGQAQFAFVYAMNIWKEIINTPQEIKVKAIWKGLGVNKKLAESSPSIFVKNFSNAPESDIFYAISLAETFSGSNLNKEKDPNNPDVNFHFIDEDNWQYDIVITFNSDREWYYGTDGNTEENEYDFVTTALHEFCHGLGFFDSFGYNADIGSWGLGSSNTATIFDKYVIQGAGNNVIINTYSNNSSALGGALCCDNLFWGGQNGYYMNLTGYPKIYAPVSWKNGSSIAHWDEATYQAGNTNSLMSPKTGTAEAIHSPGEITYGLLKDIGWNVSRIVTVTSPATGSIWKKGTEYSIQWSDTEENDLGISLVTNEGIFVCYINASVLSYIGKWK